jgi:hypothetical protein
VRAVALAHLERDPGQALATILDAGAGDYAEWPAWLPVAVDLLVHELDDEPLRAALAALRGPVAPTTAPHVNAQIERLAAHLAARAGDTDAAVGHWRAAQRISDEAGIVFDSAVIALELAEHAGETATTLGDAIATFERLGAEPWLVGARQLYIGDKGTTTL